MNVDISKVFFRRARVCVCVCDYFGGVGWGGISLKIGYQNNIYIYINRSFYFIRKGSPFFVLLLIADI